MNIVDELLSELPPDLAQAPVEDLLVGLYWTAVRVAGRVGLANTWSEERCCLAGELPGRGQWHERCAGDLAALLRTGQPITASVGLAALNALLPADTAQSVPINARDLLLSRADGHNVALVGHFAFTPALRQKARRLWVLEITPVNGDLPADAAPDVLPQADIVGVTATTLMNGTFAELERLFAPGAFVVMIGPSTPLTPVLFSHHIDVLAGSHVTDPAAVWRAVAQASNLHGQTPGLERLTLSRPAAHS